jgi:hypothetical protein
VAINDGIGIDLNPLEIIEQSEIFEIGNYSFPSCPIPGIAAISENSVMFNGSSIK